MGYALRRMWLPQGVATLLRNQWQLCRGMRGNFAMESVASFAWNQWQLSYGTGGNFRAEYAILEAHWNGTLLETVDTVLQWARTMTWKAVRPIVQLLDKVYANGVRVAKKAFRKIEERLERHASLPKYCVRIQPQGG